MDFTNILTPGSRCVFTPRRDSFGELTETLAIRVAVPLAPFHEGINVGYRRSKVQLVGRLMRDVSLTPANRGLSTEPLCQSMVVTHINKARASQGRTQCRLGVGTVRAERRSLVSCMVGRHAAALCFEPLAVARFAETVASETSTVVGLAGTILGLSTAMTDMAPHHSWPQSERRSGRVKISLTCGTSHEKAGSTAPESCAIDSYG